MSIKNKKQGNIMTNRNILTHINQSIELFFKLIEYSMLKLNEKVL